jgi:hypothetical protein
LIEYGNGDEDPLNNERGFTEDEYNCTVKNIYASNGKVKVKPKPISLTNLSSFTATPARRP